MDFGNQARAGRTVVRNARVFDGKQVLDAVDVAFSTAGIEAVGKGLPSNSGARKIDGRDHTLLPGLMDCHIHVGSSIEVVMSTILRIGPVFGVTTSVDMGSKAGVAGTVKAREKSDPSIGTTLSAGVLATCPGGHPTEMGGNYGSPTVSGPEDARDFVAARVLEGSDILKLVIEDGSQFNMTQPSLDEDTVTALVREAKRHQLATYAHVSTESDARVAMRAGVNGIVHAFVDQPPSPDFTNAFSASGMIAVPTLCVCEPSQDNPLGRDLRVQRHLSPLARNLMATTRSSVDMLRRHLENSKCVARDLFLAGAPVMTGTDAPNPGTMYGASLHRELQLLVESGLSPVDALASATSIPASHFGLTDRGRIQTGLRADLVLVKGDPTKDIEHTLDIEHVWINGTSIERTTFDDG